MRMDLRGGSPGLIFAPSVTIQTGQSNIGKQIIGGKLQGFLDCRDPLLKSSGFTISDTELIVSNGDKRT